MKQKLFIAGGVLLAIIFVAAIVLVAKLDSLITNAVNTYGPEFTGTDVRAGDVRVSFLSGEATVTNFFLGNPRGFRSTHAAKAASISVDLEIGSLLHDTIVVKRIEVVQPDIIYEKRGGTDNFKTLAKHAERKAKEAGLADGGKGKEKPGRKLRIREFLVKRGRVTLYTPDLPSGTASAVIPDMHLKNAGGKDGAPPERVLSQVLFALHDRLTMPIVMDALNRSLLDARKAADKGTRSLADRIKGIFQ